MRRVLALALVLLAAPVLAGCIEQPGAEVDPNAVRPDLGLPQAESLWPDHQNEPHPAFGWPTLTHPAGGEGLPAFWAPIPEANLTKITGLKPVGKSPEGVKSGAGIALFGSLAVVPGFTGPTSILDISDPTKPQLVSTIEGKHRGAAVIAYPDGRLVAVFSTGAGIQAYNITDPAHPTLAADLKPKSGGHKVGVVPGTPIVYNANSDGEAGGQTEIYDLTNPENATLVQEFKNGYGCHHIFFWNDAAKEKSRAICAGLEMTQIWDTADPRNPKVIVNVPVHHGNPALPSLAVTPVMFSHFAILSEKGDTLIVGDEFMGGGRAECDGVSTPFGDVAGPLGNLWFYDVKDEKNPQLLGWFSPPARALSGEVNEQGCTAHHGRLVPDPEGKRQLLAMAWYAAGTVLVDFTDPMNPSMVSQFDQGTNTWEAWYYNGYVFTGDLARGLDVLSLG